MSRVRSLFLWFLMLALPLQGLAASSLLFCSIGDHGAQPPAALSVAQAHGGALAGHEAAHVHAAPTSEAAASPGQAGDLSHACGLCASCCVQVAIASQPPALALGAAPQADLAEPSARIRTLPSRVPKRPPRA